MSLQPRPLRTLGRMGIDDAALFPDLDGAARWAKSWSIALRTTGGVDGRRGRLKGFKRNRAIVRQNRRAVTEEATDAADCKRNLRLGA